MASALAFWVPWAIAGVLAGALTFCAWYGPNQDVSNLSRWAWLAGWRNSPLWLRARSADRWMMRGGALAALLLVVAAGLWLFLPSRAPEPASNLPPMPEIEHPLPEPDTGPPEPQQPDRQLDDELKNAIRVHVPKDKSVKLVVLAGDAEATRFADQLEAFLKAEGYRLAPRAAFAGGAAFTGTRLFPDANDPGVFVIQVGLNDRK